MTTETRTSIKDAKPVELPAVAKRTADDNFTAADAYKTWRLVSRNRAFNGETEGFGFSNGEAVATAIPSIVTCPSMRDDDTPEQTLERCGQESEGNYCRVHLRVVRLNNISRENYMVTQRVRLRNGQTHIRRFAGYEVLSEDDYEAKYHAEEADDEGEVLPSDF